MKDLTERLKSLVSEAGFADKVRGAVGFVKHGREALKQSDGLKMTSVGPLPRKPLDSVKGAIKRYAAGDKAGAAASIKSGVASWKASAKPAVKAYAYAKHGGEAGDKVASIVDAMSEHVCLQEGKSPKPSPMGKLDPSWKGPKWRTPSLKKEHPELVRQAKEWGIKTAEIRDAAKQGKLAPLSRKHWKRMDNTWSWGISAKNHKKWAGEIGRDTDRIAQGFKDGVRMPAPIVVHRDGKPPTLVAGNTRLAAAYVHGVKPEVLHVHLKKKS